MNVTQEERDFISEYHKPSEPQEEAHWSEGLGICNSRDYKLESYVNKSKSSRSMKVVEDNMGLRKPLCQISTIALWQIYIVATIMFALLVKKP